MSSGLSGKINAVFHMKNIWNWHQKKTKFTKSSDFQHFHSTFIKFSVNFVHYSFETLQKRNTSLSRRHFSRTKNSLWKNATKWPRKCRKNLNFPFSSFFMQFLFNIRKISWKRRSIVFTNRRSSEQFAIPKRTLQRFSSKTFQNDSQWVKKLQHLHVLMQLVNTFWTLLYSKGVKQSITTKLVIL